MPEPRRPYFVGLTGSIGMGKTATLAAFAAEGIPVHDSDAAVHRLYAEGGAAVALIKKAFPSTVTNGAVDRGALSRRIASEPGGVQTLERLIHPLVAAERQRFVDEAAARGDPIVVFDIPLLFETGADTGMDAIVVASAPSDVQRARVLARPGMTAEKFDLLHARQTPDTEKRAKAHFVVVTDQGLSHGAEQVRMIIAEIRKRLSDHA